ncbi:MAG: hypothetical protein L0H23_07820, partial [Luteimonas sp.]|nr:hypothetical protein [Luteimonas sp.]
MPGQTEANALAWTRDSHWLLLETPRQLFALATGGQAGSGIVATLGGLTERSFIGVDPAQPASALLLEHDRARAGRPERWRLLRADMRGRVRVLHADAHKITGQAFDAAGRLAYLQRVEGDALAIHRVDARGALHPLLRCERLHRCSLLPRTDAAGRLLLRHDLDGSLSRLARVDADGRLRTLHVDPRGESDLDDVALDPASGEPLVASYRGTQPDDEGLTDAARRNVDALARRFPRRGLSIEAGHGDDAPWLVA